MFIGADSDLRRPVWAWTGSWPRCTQRTLLRIHEQPDYDTSYMEDRRVAKDCTLSYRGNRYSVPFRYAGKTVLVREPVKGGRIQVYSDIKVIAEHELADDRGRMVIDPEHYQGLGAHRHSHTPTPAPTTSEPAVELAPGPGVGHGFVPPDVEQRSLEVYEEVTDVPTI